MKIKTIIASVSAVLVVTAMSVAAFWASHIPNDMVCRQVKINISDSTEYQFVGEKELLRTLQNNSLSPVGKIMDDISCQAIEDLLLKHDMIRSAECYKLLDGKVLVNVTQRIPMLCVSSSEGKYYVDSDRKVMPARASIQVQVPIFKGEISQQKAITEYYDFAQWLTQNRYWQPRITQVQVQNNNHIVLMQQPVEGRIILGALKDYESKMNRLRKLYVDGLDHIGYKPYKEYDLRYSGQVIGRY
ncbi:MAG: hypothetical protein IKY87_07800 [Paludibacteraceae bacterium]|nr:hypothetical protein [Paludibacteraceae bacterium]